MITSGPIHIGDDLGVAVSGACGAVASFAGVVRDHNDGRPVTGIYYECYAEMAERELRRIIEENKKRFDLHDAAVRHRTGELVVGDVSLLVVVSAVHRQEAFDACRSIVEDIKKRVPIWKKERYADGAASWIGGDRS